MAQVCRRTFECRLSSRKDAQSACSWPVVSIDTWTGGKSHIAPAHLRQSIQSEMVSAATTFSYETIEHTAQVHFCGLRNRVDISPTVARPRDGLRHFGANLERIWVDYRQSAGLCL